MAKCRRCGRKLTAETSVRRGYGPTCAGKVEAAVTAAMVTFKPAQVSKALALIADGDIAPSGRNSFYTAKTYRTDASSCTCMAGQNGRTCYHLIAARVLDAVKAA